MRKKLLCILAILCLILTSCKSTDISYISKTDLIMGTIVDIQIYGHTDNSILEAAMKRLKHIEEIMSINIKDSELSKININSGIKKVAVSDDTFNVLETSLYYAKLSDGKFDPTIAPLVKLWGIGSDEAKVPSDKQLRQALNLIDYTKVKLYPDDKSVFLEQEGMGLDLGAIAKGYSADQVHKLLRDKGVKSAIINIGGNIIALGKHPKGSPWNIGIQDPNKPTGNYMGILKSYNSSIVTSGIYERYLDVDNQKLHHILDVSTGYPANNDILSVTIINKSSIDGDALSTVAFLLGSTDALSLIESIPNTECIIITKNNEVYLSSGVKDNFILSNNYYTIKNH
ncbi:FAD:protein FMN transferase [Alkalithermobacter paradoxus]|uniref:FAD:protein FMN transferase n=1 Tax=Alkalithermobacter paradoxus TaxID=29349 RepID=A0A1V4IB50_9FIRM|nr:thiamine biosynthesis lipoprotein ApbE precursor [[Clostridium] thermoalcaliphilum]